MIRELAELVELAKRNAPLLVAALDDARESLAQIAIAAGAIADALDAHAGVDPGQLSIIEHEEVSS